MVSDSFINYVPKNIQILVAEVYASLDSLQKTSLPWTLKTGYFESWSMPIRSDTIRVCQLFLVLLNRWSHIAVTKLYIWIRPQSTSVEGMCEPWCNLSYWLLLGCQEAVQCVHTAERGKPEHKIYIGEGLSTFVCVGFVCRMSRFSSAVFDRWF